ncbi:MAG: hypothetical protein QOF83_1770 [Solirubrobacteraceae bacterium]|jgi:uncharacterized protein (UPF0548 family)|nr:hypothetical protein [Solirubrobacteraceae bacterium]
MRQRLDALSSLPVNYDVAALDLEHPPNGWNVDDRRQPLPSEPPGEPVRDGSFAVARQLIKGYEFADPSVVRAYYVSDEPYPGRDMLLELRALGLLKIRVGVRVCDVYDAVRSIAGREVRVFGWSYRTLEGHVERGQMDWEVWKWIETGDVEFHVRAVSRPARIANPFIRLGFWLLRRHERGVFLNSTNRRMVRFTELALPSGQRGQRVREASGGLTARHLSRRDPAHDELARQIDPPTP